MEDLKYFASTNVILETQIISIFKVRVSEFVLWLSKKPLMAKLVLYFFQKSFME